MSLLDSMKTACKMMDRSTVSDGLGGFSYTWTEGADFEAVIRKDSSPEMAVAQKQGLSEFFTVIVDKSVSLEYHDVFKRVSDSATFRVTGSTRDSTAPDVSSVPIAKATCERWDLT